MKWHERIFYFFLAFLPTQLSKHFWPSWSLILGRRIDYLSPTLYFSDLLLCLLFIFWILEDLSHITKIIKKRIRQILFTFLALLLITIGNIYTSGGHPATWLFWIIIWKLVLFISYILFTRPRLTRVIYSLSIAAVWSSFLAISQFLLQHSLGGPLWWLGERTFTSMTPGIARMPLCLPSLVCRLFLRPYATFPHPNLLGGFLATILTLLFGVLMNKKIPVSVHHRRWYAFVFSVSFIALLLTVSRSAWVAVTMGISGIGFFNRRKKNNAQMTGILLGMIFALLLLILWVFPHATDESVVTRSLLMNLSLSAWDRNIFLGVGGNSFLSLLPILTANRSPGFLQPVHSIYLLLLAETGIVGLGDFLSILGLVFYRLTTLSSRLPTSYRYIRYVVGLALLELLVLGFVDHYPLTLLQGQFLFSLFLGLGLTQPEKK